MANWQFHLELKECRDAFDKDGNLEKMCAAHVVAIKGLVKKVRSAGWVDEADELENDIMPMFEEIAGAEAGEYDTDDYDNALKNLYDWADAPLNNEWPPAKMCWVNTF